MSFFIGDLNSINCHKTKNNSNENVSPASSFKSLNEDILLNQLEPSVSNEESNDLDTSNENVKVICLKTIIIKKKTFENLPRNRKWMISHQI